MDTTGIASEGSTQCTGQTIRNTNMLNNPDQRIRIHAVRDLKLNFNHLLKKLFKGELNFPERDHDNMLVQ